MSAFGIILIALGAFYFGFACAALFAAGRDNMEDYLNTHKLYPDGFDRIDRAPGNDSRVVKESLTTAPQWKPPFNWCGEQAIGAPFDEYGMVNHCCTCGAEMPEGNQVCVDCLAKAGKESK